MCTTARGSRARLRVFARSAVTDTRNDVPSNAVSTFDDWGEPSARTVMSTARVRPVSQSRAVSVRSAIGSSFGWWWW